MTTERCHAEVFVQQYGEFRCEKELGHDGLHQASVTGEWEAVMWPEGTTVIIAPGWRRRE